MRLKVLNDLIDTYLQYDYLNYKYVFIMYTYASFYISFIY